MPPGAAAAAAAAAASAIAAAAPPPPPGSPAEKLAALNERLRGAELLTLLNIKAKPAPEALHQRVGELRDVIFSLCAHLPADDPHRAVAIERLKSVEALMSDPLEWHILSRAQALKQDASDPTLREQLEAAFYEEHVPRTVWQSMPPDGTHAELRKSLRLPMLLDVELDVAGKKTRCQMQNLSRDGVCLEVPAGFSEKHVAFTLTLPTSNQAIALAGDVVWRDTGRVGVAFKIGVTEQNALDAALLGHFASLTRTCERWRQIAPSSGNAIACSEVVGYASSALPSSRREHLDRLAAAADAMRDSKDLQLALAKLRIEEKDFDGATVALKRVTHNDRNDPRYRLLELTLEQRSGRRIRGAGIRQSIAAARIPVIAIAFIAVVAAGVYAFVMSRGPLESVAVPIGGLPCQRMEHSGATVFCYLDANAFGQLSPAEQATLADKTLTAFAAKNINTITVFNSDGTVPVDVFTPAVIASMKKP